MSIFGKRHSLLTTYYIPPHGCLSAFVDYYMYSTSGYETASLDGIWTAGNETSLIFFLADAPLHVPAEKGAVLSGKSSCLIGLLTRSNGIVRLNGRYRTFNIQFKAQGICNIFQIQMTELTNRIFSAEDVFGKAAKDLHEQLGNTADMHLMAALADKFLLSFLNRGKNMHAHFNRITAITNQLNNVFEILPVAEYAYQANMSMRNFERRFSEQVGTSAKEYTKLLRFNAAIKMRLLQPEKGWMSVAYDCGYYDYQHMVKDFKTFTGFTPKAFFEQNEDLLKPYVDVSKRSSLASKQNEEYMSEEAFVFVKRVLK